MLGNYHKASNNMNSQLQNRLRLQKWKNRGKTLMGVRVEKL
jgi:hypothetical protein